MRYYLSHQDWTVSSNNSICCFQNIDTVTSSYIQFIFIISDFGPLAVRHYALINTLSRFCEDLFDTRKKSLPITSAMTMAIFTIMYSSRNSHAVADALSNDYNPLLTFISWCLPLPHLSHTILHHLLWAILIASLALFVSPCPMPLIIFVHVSWLSRCASICMSICPYISLCVFVSFSLYNFFTFTSICMFASPSLLPSFSVLLSFLPELLHMSHTLFIWTPFPATLAGCCRKHMQLNWLKTWNRRFWPILTTTQRSLSLWLQSYHYDVEW